MAHCFRKMAGGSTQAYTVTVMKDKHPKGFYWMANTNNSYDMLKAILKKSGMTLEATKAPLEPTKAIQDYMEQTVGVLKDKLKGLIVPNQAVEICMVVRDLIDRDLVVETDMGEAMKKLYKELTEGASSQETPRRSERLLLTPGGVESRKKEQWSVPSSQPIGDHDHIFRDSPTGTEDTQSEQELPDTEKSNIRASSITESIGGIINTAENRKRQRDSTDEILESIAAAQKLQKMVQGVTEGVSEGIREEMNRAVIILQTGAHKLGESSKNNNTELKKAVSNCFGEIKKTNKRLEAIEHQAKESIRQSKVTQCMLGEVLKGLEQNNAARNSYQTKEKRELEQVFCEYCDSTTHATDRCRRKIACFRCGEDHHKQSNCPWKDRTCRICQVKGHKMEIHDTKDVKIRGELLIQFPGKFLHFLQEGLSAANSPKSQDRAGQKGSKPYRGGY